MQWEIASGDASFLRGDLCTCRLLKPSWHFGVEVVTFAVKGTELCDLTVAVLESLSDSSDKRQAKSSGSKYFTTVAAWPPTWWSLSVELGHEAGTISWARYQGKAYSHSEGGGARVDETE